MPLRSLKCVMYHGTTRAAAESILKNGFLRFRGRMLGGGVYLARDLRKATAYPINHPESDKAVIKVEVNLTNLGRVIAINHHPRQSTRHNRKGKFNLVFNTAVVPTNCGALRSGLNNCVSDPKRIKILEVIYPPRPAPTPPAPKTPAPRRPAPTHPAPRHYAPKTPALRHPAPRHPAPKTPALRHPAPRHPAPKTPAPRPPASGC